MKKLYTTFIVLCLALHTQAQITGAIGISLNKQAGDDMVLMDGSAIYYSNTSSDSIDLDDALKLANPTENIAILRGNSVLGIEYRRTRVTTNLYLWNLSDVAEYTLELTKFGIPVAVALEDLLEDTIIMLQDTPVYYRFLADENEAYNRFRIIFPCVLAVDETPVVRATREKPVFNIYPNPSVDYLYIKGLPAGKQEIVFTGQVRKVYSIISDGLNPIRIEHKLPRGMYYLSVNNITKPILVR